MYIRFLRTFMNNLERLNKELIEIENKLIQSIEKDSIKEYLLFHNQFIMKNRAWRAELVKFVEQRITEKNLADLLLEVAKKG